MVGAGNLGRRHIQGVLNSGLDILLYVVDSSKEALELSSEMIRSEHENVQFFCLTNYKEIDDQIDLAIVATTANNRLALLADLIELKVANIVAEKVLFNSISEIKAGEKLPLGNSKLWVNCPRRYYPEYESLKEEILNQKIRKIEIEGINFGLACNGIHFIDLASFLCNDNYFDSFEYNYNSLMESKRKGFVEVFGEYNASFRETKLKLNCSFQSDLPPSYKIKIYLSDDNVIIINELSGNITRKKGQETVKISNISLPFQSELTSVLAKDILISGQCKLTPFDISIRIHKPFISSLYSFYSSEYKENSHQYVPVT